MNIDGGLPRLQSASGNRFFLTINPQPETLNLPWLIATTPDFRKK